MHLGGCRTRSCWGAWTACSDLQAQGHSESSCQVTTQKGEINSTVCQEQFSHPISFELEEFAQLTEVWETDFEAKKQTCHVCMLTHRHEHCS